MAVLVCVPATSSTRSDPNVMQEAGVVDSPLVSAIDDLALANRLARYGIRQRDPYALVEAAQIRKRVTGGGAQAGSAVVAGHYSVADLLRIALDLGRSDSTLKARVAAVRGLVTKQIPLELMSVNTLRRSIPANANDRAVLAFAGRVPAVVYADAASDVRLSLSVYDEFNNLICERTTAEEPRCQWRPSWTGAFVVDIRNAREEPVAYVLAANDVPLAERKVLDGVPAQP